MSELRSLIGPFMICGIALGMAVEPHLSGKQPLSNLASLGILVATIVFVIWNIVLYKKAGIQPDPDFPTSAFERFLPPIAASISFIVGAFIILFQ